MLTERILDAYELIEKGYSERCILAIRVGSGFYECTSDVGLWYLASNRLTDKASLFFYKNRYLVIPRKDIIGRTFNTTGRFIVFDKLLSTTV